MRVMQRRARADTMDFVGAGPAMQVPRRGHTVLPSVCVCLTCTMIHEHLELLNVGCSWSTIARRCDDRMRWLALLYSITGKPYYKEHFWALVQDHQYDYNVANAKIDSATQVLQDSLESRPALRSRFAQVPAQHTCDA